MPLLTGEILRLTARRWPDKTAIIDGARDIAYRALDQAADHFAAAIAALGVAKGAHVGVILPNRLEYGIVNFGLARSGAVACHLSYRATADDVAATLGLVGAVVAVVDTSTAAIVAAARDRLPALRDVIVIDDDGRGFADMLAARAAVPPAVALDVEDTLAVTFTGGTTGRPKAAVASHRARSWTSIAAAFEFGIHEADVMILPAPLFHTAGMCIWFQPAVLIGATMVLQPRWDVATFFDAVERHRVTAAFMVPTQLGDMVRDPGFAPDRLASLRAVDFAAAPMPDVLFDELTRRLPAVEFVENYGATEAGLMTVRKPWFNDTKRGSVGRPVINTEIRVVDGAGRDLPTGQPGEVIQRGGGSFAGYFDDPTGTAEVFRLDDGWVWTGDIGYLDDDRFLFLVDRSKEMMISGGENLYPKEIEDALYAHDAVEECAVFGVPDERLGEIPAAHVVLKPGARIDAEALIEHCAAHIARHKRPRLVRFVDALPKTTVGKIQKNVIRAPYWQHRR